MTYRSCWAFCFCLLSLLALVRVHTLATQFEQIHEPWLERWR
jgi:hypothetical protein